MFLNYRIHIPHHSWIGTVVHDIVLHYNKITVNRIVVDDSKNTYGTIKKELCSATTPWVARRNTRNSYQTVSHYLDQNFHDVFYGVEFENKPIIFFKKSKKTTESAPKITFQILLFYSHVLLFNRIILLKKHWIVLSRISHQCYSYV